MPEGRKGQKAPPACQSGEFLRGRVVGRDGSQFLAVSRGPDKAAGSARPVLDDGINLTDMERADAI